MKSTLRTCSFIASLAFGLVAAPAAFAQGTWNFGSGNCAVGGTGATGATTSGSATLSSSETCGATSTGAGTATATVSMWANTGAGGLFVQGQLSNQGGSGAGGVASGESATNSPDHAFDNLTPGGNQQFMLINFTERLNLSAVTIGWWGEDADMAIYRWDGASAPTPGTTLSGWKLVSSKDVDQGATYGSNATKSFGVNDSTAVNGGNGLNLYSSWWLISTFTGGSAGTTAAALGNDHNDAFKLLSFAAGNCTGTGNSLQGGATTSGNGASCGPRTTGGAREPGWRALGGLAMLGIFATRRKGGAAA